MYLLFLVWLTLDVGLLINPNVNVACCNTAGAWLFLLFVAALEDVAVSQVLGFSFLIVLMWKTS